MKPRYTFSPAIRFRRLFVMAAALVLATVLAACRAPDRPGGAAGETISLEGTEWVLAILNGRPPLANTRITLEFGPQGAGGSAGCNRYGVAFTTDGNRLAFSDGAQTEMACGTPGVMEQEEAYMKTLLSVASYGVIEGRLELRNTLGQTVLVFDPQAQADMDPAALVGTAWQLVSMASRSPLVGSTLTLTFLEGNQVYGHAGCRGYVGGYTAEGDDIVFPSLGMLGTVCFQQAFLEQEGRFTTLLSETTDYRLSEGRLELLARGGETLVFDPLTAQAGAPLEGTTWALIGFVESLQEPDVPFPVHRVTERREGTEVTLTLQGGQATGSAGCNTYSVAYVLDAAVATPGGAALTFQAPSATKMMCGQPEGLMNQESLYLDWLDEVTAYRVSGDMLRLEVDKGRAIYFTAPRS